MKDIRVILVFSQLNYVPKNYLTLLEDLIVRNKKMITGVVFLNNLNFSILKTIIGMSYLKTYKIQKSLFKNLVSLRSDPRKKLLKEQGIPYQSTKSINDTSIIEWIRHQECDLIVNLRTRSIYKKEILNIPKYGCINLHHGILPQYRGVMCDLYALSENREAGFSIHAMNEKIDDGLIYKRVVVIQKNEKENDYMRYLEKCIKKEGQEIMNVIKNISKNEKPINPQYEDVAIVFSKNPDKQMIANMMTKGMVL